MVSLTPKNFYYEIHFFLVNHDGFGRAFYELGRLQRYQISLRITTAFDP